MVPAADLSITAHKEDAHSMDTHLPGHEAGRIEIARHNALCAITIHNPARRNAMTLAMWHAMARAVQEADEDHGVHLITLRGFAGTFVSGADISEFEAERATVEKAASYEAANGAAFAALRTAKTPTLALIEGFCFGGGVGLAAACDLRLASETAKFCVPAAKLGLAYPVAGVRDLVQLIGPAPVKQLFFTAQPIDAPTALRFGLVENIAPQSSFDEAAQALIDSILAHAPLTQRAAKSAIAAVFDPALESAAQGDAQACFASDDYQEGRKSFLDKRKPVFFGR